MKAITSVIAAILLLCAGGTALAENVVLRVGHFPNVTHVQALVARAMEREGKGWFQQKLGDDVKIEWFTYNAGPSAMEAIFANSIDMTYVGPSPALNAYAKSRGAEVRILSGAMNGGEALVVQGDSTLKTPADFRGKKIATPQLGNTQDVNCRAWLVAGGLKITQLGGDAQVLPTANPDQLPLFQAKQLDGVWTAEPWVTRLIREAGAKVLVEDPESIATILVSSSKMLKEKPDLAKKFAAAHKELTAWIKANPEEAQRLVASELTELTKGKISPELIAEAWKRLVITDEVSATALQTYVEKAKSVGFLKDAPDLKQIFP